MCNAALMRDSTSPPSLRCIDSVPQLSDNCPTVLVFEVKPIIRAVGLNRAIDLTVNPVPDMQRIVSTPNSVTAL